MYNVLPRRFASALIALVLASVPLVLGQPSNCKDARTWRKCPSEGCAQKGTPEAEANAVRNMPLAECLTNSGMQNAKAAREPKVLTISDFETLQIATNDMGLQGFAIPLGERKKYETFKEKELGDTRLAAKKPGEKQLVAVVGYIVGTPRARRADSANCKIVGREHNSFRINIAEEYQDTEFESIIAEITPRCRPASWKLEMLRRHANNKESVVKVVGQLFYDSKHLVNSDPDNELPGQPKRLSLWEIHPVTGMWICNKPRALCDAQNKDVWDAIEKHE